MDKIAQKSLEKLPPYDVEAEQAILGAILLDDTALAAALTVFDPVDFYRASHAKIFAAMRDLIAHGGAIDLILLRDELERRGQLDDCGGPAYLAALSDQVPTAANVTSHAKIVREKAEYRHILNAAIEAACKCYDAKTPVDDIAAQLRTVLDHLRGQDGFAWVLFVEYEPHDFIQSVFADWLAAALGFRRFPLKSGSLCIRIERERVLCETRWTQNICEDLKDAVRAATADAPGVYDMLLSKGTKPFSFGIVTDLPKFPEMNLLRDTKDCCYLHFENGSVQITPNEKTFIPLDKLPKYIWKDAIVPREYHGRYYDGQPADIISVFEQVVEHVTVERYEDEDKVVHHINNKKVCEHGLFRLMHHWTDPSTPVSVVFIDHNPSNDYNDGGRGKGLMIDGIYWIKSNGTMNGVVIILDGRKFGRSNFPMQRLRANTEVLVVDDVDESQVSIKDFYAFLTGAAEAEVKGKLTFAYPREYPPKLGFTANRPFFSHDLSSARRLLVVPVNDYFQREGCSPLQLFKRRLFYEWDAAEWTHFDDYMIDIVGANIGLAEMPKPNLSIFNEYRLMMEMDDSLIRLFDEMPRNQDCPISKAHEGLALLKYPKALKDADIYREADTYCRLKKMTLKRNADGKRLRKNSLNYLHFEDPQLLKRMKGEEKQ